MPSEPVDFLSLAGKGPLWGIATDDLNATLLSWPPDSEVADHVNDERDVLFVVLDGAGTLRLDGEAHPVGPAFGCVIAKGVRRGIVAGPEGIRYLTSHRVRGGLAIKRVG